MVLPGPRPLMTPTTPVRPIPVTTSSTPNERSSSATFPAVRVHVVLQFGVRMEIAAPLGDLVGEIPRCG